MKNKSSKNKKNSTVRSEHGGSGTIRIVAGQWRRAIVMVADSPGLRPTLGRVRETVFSWLYSLIGELEGKACLDMFAGTGILGLEAMSRGAQYVKWIEKEPKLAQAIKDTLVKFKASGHFDVICQDAFLALQNEKRSFDVIFIDPPFEKNWQAKAVTRAVEVLASDGILYVEHEKEGLSQDIIEANHLVRLRQGRAGDVVYELFVKKTSSLVRFAKR